MLFSGGDDDGIADVGFVFVVGAVAGLFGFLRAFVVVGCGAAQFRFQGGSSGRVLRPRVEHVEDRQGRAAVRGRIADGDLFLHREQLDHPQQRPVQFAQRVVRSSDPQFAATERLLERAELQFDVPAQLIGLARRVAGQCFWIEDVGDQIDRRATELPQQRDVAPDAHQEVTSPIGNPLPEVVIDEARVVAIQRFPPDFLDIQQTTKSRCFSANWLRIGVLAQTMPRLHRER